MTSENDIVLAVSGFAALVLGGVALALAAAALRARALFVAGVFASLVAATACAALLAHGAALAAVALALTGAALLLVWMLGGVLLSAASAKARRGAAWLTFLMAFAAGGLILVVAPELAATQSPHITEPRGLPALLSALMLAASLSVIGLIGYGERGALERRGQGAP
jgi:hypothetical protein